MEKEKAALARAHADSGMVHVQAALLVKGLHENEHVSAEQGREPHVFSCPLPATLASPKDSEI